MDEIQAASKKKGGGGFFGFGKKDVEETLVEDNTGMMHLTLSKEEKDALSKMAEAFHPAPESSNLLKLAGRIKVNSSKHPALKGVNIAHLCYLDRFGVL